MPQTYSRRLMKSNCRECVARSKNGLDIPRILAARPAAPFLEDILARSGEADRIISAEAIAG